MIAKNIVTNDLVLKVTVPKRTGLKRKRGTSGSFQESPQGHSCLPTSESTAVVANDTRCMLRTLRDNIKTYQIQPVGSIYQTHRFRGAVSCQTSLRIYRDSLMNTGIPDFVYSTTDSTFMKKMKEDILTFECTISFSRFVSQLSHPRREIEKFQVRYEQGTPAEH